MMKVPVSTSISADGDGGLEYFEREIGLDVEISMMFVDLRRVSHLMEENDNGTLKIDKSELRRAIVDAEMAVDKLVRGGRYDLRTVKGVHSNSGCCILAGCLYVYYFLRRIPATSALYDYMVRLLKEDFETVAGTFRQVFPKEVLFWILFVGALSAMCREEEAWFKKELAMTRHALSIATWEVAKFILKKFAWVEDGFEDVAKKLFNSLERL
jgi:hypothetical protein